MPLQRRHIIIKLHISYSMQLGMTIPGSLFFVGRNRKKNQLDVLQRLTVRPRLPAQLSRHPLSQLPDVRSQSELSTSQAAYECYRSRDGIVRHAALASGARSCYSHLLTVPPTSVA
jgi:hypothetical protein